MTFSSRLQRYITSKLWLRMSLIKQSPFKKCLRYCHSGHWPRIHSLPSKHFIMLAAFLFISIHATEAGAETLRCGTKLIREDDLAIQVREKCGDPVSEELIGYKLGAAPPGLRGERELKIEQWIYGPDQGYYHVVIFEGGRVRSIDNVRQ